jgi:hypothetical protein
MSEMKIDADPQAVRFIRDHGGRLFVWASDAGIEHETTKPHNGVAFDEVQGDGFTLCVDQSIEMPHGWRLVFHRFPTPHVRALWNERVWSPSGARMLRWEGGPPSNDPRLLGRGTETGPGCNGVHDVQTPWCRTYPRATVALRDPR